MHLPHPHLHRKDDNPSNNGPEEHPVLDATLGTVISLFSTQHHDSWEDAVKRYDETHPNTHPSVHGTRPDRTPQQGT